MGLLPNSNIVVDHFAHTADLSAPHYVFFLTHMHTDHTAGLTPSWDRGPIYCSPLTAVLLKDKFPGISDVRSLEMDETHWVYLDQDCRKGVEVTLIDANHCPGSVMFLFKGYLGTILHTGDFRFCQSMLEHPALVTGSGLIEIDQLFLDNTFCSPDFAFPPKAEVLAEIISIIERSAQGDVWIAIETLGKEDLLIALAEHFKTLIVVNEARYHSIELLNLRPELFTTNKEEGWIKVVRRAELKTIGEEWKRGSPTLAMIMSGWHKESSQVAEYVYKLPYSLHSSFPELLEFVKAIKPKLLTCTVHTSTSMAGVSMLREHERLSEHEVTTPDHTFHEANLSRFKRKAEGDELRKVKRVKTLGSRIV
jgi:DNA cross-link repair 1B protein